MKTWQQRLAAVQQGGNLTVADLARWFDRPHATVREWVKNGVEPGGGPNDIEHAEALLGLLETMIRKRKGFPVPRLSPRERVAHVTRVREAVMP